MMEFDDAGRCLVAMVGWSGMVRSHASRSFLKLLSEGGSALRSRSLEGRELNRLQHLERIDSLLIRAVFPWVCVS